MAQLWQNPQTGSPVVQVTAQPTLSWCAVTMPSNLRYSGTSVQNVHAALKRAFRGQHWPLKLNAAEHLGILQGMAAAALDGSEPYDILHTALEKFGEIEIRDK